LANDLAGVKLLLTAVSMATEEEERARHINAAKQSLLLGESRLQALRAALRSEPPPATRRPQPNLRK
jgi:hypothetical protein